MHIATAKGYLGLCRNNLHNVLNSHSKLSILIIAWLWGRGRGGGRDGRKKRRKVDGGKQAWRKGGVAIGDCSATLPPDVIISSCEVSMMSSDVRKLLTIRNKHASL